MLVRSVAAGLALSVLALPADAREGIAWGYNSYGVLGLIDMPAAMSRPDAELAFSVSHLKNQTRTAATFQITPRLSGTFRYSFLYDVRATPYATEIYDYIYDRSFSFHYRLLDEGVFLPALAVGINDIVGTGIYSGEYVVATKSLTEGLRATVGLGWGRLGGPNWRGFSRGSMGGTFEPDYWFRGDTAVFGGIEWQASDRLRFVAEYSSDEYLFEDDAAFDRKSPVNLGLSWQATPSTNVSARWLYGSELGLQVNYALNPKAPRGGSGEDPAPLPVVRREALGRTGEDPLRSALEAEGLLLNALQVEGATATVEVENARYSLTSQALGRTARVLTRTLPAGVEHFRILLADDGLPVTSVTLGRSDLEDLEFAVDAPELMRAHARIETAPPALPAMPDRWPLTEARLTPYIAPSYFDPDQPVRADVGIDLRGTYEPARGLVFSGVLRQKLAGDLDQVETKMISVLPHVRSDGALYAGEGETALSSLTGAYYFRPAPEVFGRVTVGYLEPMFAGVSAEVLWKPNRARYALGVEVNRVQQRDYDQKLGLRDYTVTTGHVSGYWDIGNGFTTQLDVGRYLAGDTGATLAVAREFENGWKVGVFATKTDVSAEDFGEGSFDKGITLTIPIHWITGRPTTDRFATVLRPVQRDGGARLDVAGRLYDKIRPLQEAELNDSWGRFWR